MLAPALIKQGKILKIVAPTNCPSCGGTLTMVNDQLFCRASDCPAQNTKKVQHFCKVLKIKGFGPSTVEKLGLVNIDELLTLTLEEAKQAGLGEKTATNLLNQITSKLTHGIPQSDFIAAMSIPLVGTSVSTKLGAVPISSVTFSELKDLGIGDKAASNFLTWRDDVWLPYKMNLWQEYIKSDTTKQKTDGTPERGEVCITGKLLDFPNRNKASEFLAEYGWTVKSSVTKNVRFLICEDDSKINSSSYKKAQSNNIPILTIKELLEEK